jgi:anti-sigma regulatory factor (Ser/Thr protein kinase)
VLADQAELAGLGPERIADLLLAVSEVATNALVHGSGKAVLRAWVEPKALVCAVHDNGHFDDLLVGRNTPPTESVGRRGLWMVNQLCDLVELRSGTGGTTVRIRVDLPPVDLPPVDLPA